MKSIKYLVVFLLVFVVLFPLNGENRKARKKLSEFQDPDSPSFVPYPYPKNRKNIIADLRYYAERFCSASRANSNTDFILAELFKANSPYKVGEILKVTNRIAKVSSTYTWLIHVMDRDGNVILRTVLDASGLWLWSAAILDKDINEATPNGRELFKRLRKIVTDDKIKTILSKSLGRPFGKQDIKKIKRVAYLSSFANFMNPICEVTLKDGNTYYYSQMRNKLYCIVNTVSWKKQNSGFRLPLTSLVQHRDCLPDTIADQVIILQEITGN